MLASELEANAFFLNEYALENLGITAMAKLPIGLWIVVSLALLDTPSTDAEVVSAGDSGFQIKIARTVAMAPAEAYRAATRNIDRWWLQEHTYTGKASNLEMDFQRGAFIEKLPNDGFVRHMEIVYHRPGKTLRLTGGLGPLQPMGVQGAMNFDFAPQGDETKIEFTYNVTGYSATGLASLAPVVNRVLEEQLDSLKRFCDGQAK